MKKFAIRVLFLATLMAFVDFLVGVSCRFLQTHAKGGDTGRMMYIADNMKEELLIFGSSRAIHHYDPRILEDSLGLSCYNCGRDGNGIIFSYGMYRLFRNRHKPRLIICDIQPNFDLEEQHNNEKYLEWLRTFYDRPGIDSIFWSVDATERWKMQCQMRRYNERFVQMASDCYRPLQNDIKGFRPLQGVMSYEPKRNATEEKEYKYDELKMEYWRRLIHDCKAHGTKLVLMASPVYHGGNPEVFTPIKELARREGIPFLYYYDNPAISNERRYFTDSVHMNEEGATAYTREIIAAIRKYL